MIRPAHEVEELSDEEFYKCVEPAFKEVRDYLDNKFIYEYVAKCIAIHYKKDAIWSDSNLEYEFKDAMEILSNMPRFKDIDVEKLKNTLEKKHSLKITSANPIRIEEI